jgi:hypothetical protein
LKLHLNYKVLNDYGGFMRPSRLILFCGLLGIIAMAVSMTGAAQQDAKVAGVTFNKNVLPILQKNCQTWSPAGEIAPMSFLTYKDTRPWAKAMKAAVMSPPDAAVVCRSRLRTFRQ